MRMIDVPIGSQFKLEGRTYEMVEDNGEGCDFCPFQPDFRNHLCFQVACANYQRKDGKSAYPKMISRRRKNDA